MCLLSTTLLILTFIFVVGSALSQLNGNDPYDLIPVTSNNSQTLGSSQPVPDDEIFEPQPLPADGGPNCQCVEYYLCSSDGSVITSGEGGLFDPRISMEGRCPGVQVCCELREGTIPPATEPMTPGSIESPPPGSCGVRGGSMNPTRLRIFNDENVTEFGEFPWMLALLRGEETEDGSTQYNLFQCGASLIHPQVALTAAHCVSSRNKEEFKIRAGEWDTQAQTEPLPYQDRTVVQIIKHPQYYSGAFYNDIALLILDSAFSLTVNVLPICLPQQDAVFDGRHCFATGWGVGAFGRGVKIETTLRKVELPMISPADCQEKLRQTRLGSFFSLHDSFVCAGGQSGKDACQGDGGGPLVCQLPNVTTFVQVGIISWGIGCGTDNVPGVYTNVARFRNWIDNSLKNMSL